MRLNPFYKLTSITLFSLFLFSCSDTHPQNIPPRIYSITPALSPTSGGGFATVKGTGFTPGVTIAFNDVLSSSVQFISDSMLTVLVPPSKKQGQASVRASNHIDQMDISTNTNELFSYNSTMLQFGAPLLVGGLPPTSMIRSLDQNEDGKSTFVATLANRQTGGMDVGLFLFDSTSQQFQGTSFYSVNDLIISMVTVDLNSDGKKDVVVGTQSGTVLIFTKDPTGKFGAPQILLPSVKDWASSRYLLPGDFNGDGILDLAVFFGNHLGVLLNDDQGIFRLSSISPIGFGSTSPVVIDFDHDSYLDLLEIIDSRVWFSKSNRDGTFLAPSLVGVIRTADQLAVGDFDGDQKQDLVVISIVNLVVSVNLFLNIPDGPLREQPPIQILTKTNTLLVFDFNGDRILDLVMGDIAGNVSVLLGAGDGTLQPPQVLGGILESTIATLADADADGKVDAFLFCYDYGTPTLKFEFNTSQ